MIKALYWKFNLLINFMEVENNWYKEEKSMRYLIWISKIYVEKIKLKWININILKYKIITFILCSSVTTCIETWWKQYK